MLILVNYLIIIFTDQIEINVDFRLNLVIRSLKILGTYMSAGKPSH